MNLSKNINIINNIVSNLVNRPLTKQLAINDAIDVSACFYICQEGTICEKNILLMFIIIDIMFSIDKYFKIFYIDSIIYK